MNIQNSVTETIVKFILKKESFPLFEVLWVKSIFDLLTFFFGVLSALTRYYGGDPTKIM